VNGFLIDTHAFLWMILDDERLSKTAREVILNGETKVFLSSISHWEIAQKFQQGKLPLPTRPQLYIPLQRTRHVLDTLIFNEQCAGHFDSLPPIHRDPFDRMLICQAIENGLTIVTNDKMIQQYPIRTLW